MSINHFEKTKKYYADWLDIPVEQLDVKGISLIETPQRRICPKGHPKNLELYCVAFTDSLYISFSPELDNEINFSEVYKNISDTADGVSKLNTIFPEKLKHRKAHYFTELPKDIETSNVVMLRKENYEDYLSFFVTQHPNASPDGWLLDYFKKLVENNRCFGVFKDNILVCVTGAPDIPFMEGIITEPGIDTLANYRGKGYAKAACAKYLAIALMQNETPIWTCWHNNTASYKLAEKLGYKYFCDLYTIEGVKSYSE